MQKQHKWNLLVNPVSFGLNTKFKLFEAVLIIKHVLRRRHFRMVGGRQKTRVSLKSYGTGVEQDPNPDYYLSLLRRGHRITKADVGISGPTPAEARSSNQSVYW